MSFKIKLSKPPAGYATGNAKGGEKIWVCVQEFTTTDDGSHFISRLEGFPTAILEALPSKKMILPSQVDHLLAVVHPDGTCDVYVNEIPIAFLARSAGSIGPWEQVMKDDVAEIARLDLGGIDVPSDCGVFFLMSVGWRKGLFYDVSPLGTEKEPRAYDLGATLGQIYAFLLFQERFRISDNEWKVMFEQGWFPFIGLGSQLIDKVVAHARAGWQIDDLIDEALAILSERLPRMLEAWKSHAVFKRHAEILERAVERYLAGDHVSCTGLVFPRIEGLMRTYYKLLKREGKPTDPKLAKTSVEGRPEIGPLMPKRFREYLNDVYFKNYSRADPEPQDVSRHSVGHGEATAFDKKSSTIGLLIIQQLFLMFEPLSDAAIEEEENDE